MKNEKTSARVLVVAAKVMNGTLNKDNITNAQLKALAASCLTQAPGKVKDKVKFAMALNKPKPKVKRTVR